MNAAPAAAFFWLAAVVPIDDGMFQECADTGWDVDHRMAIGWTGLQENDIYHWVFTETTCDHASG